MQKIKNLACLLVFSLLLFSCGEYQKVLNKGSIEDQYKMAVKMYESKKYSKALRLFEKVKPAYRGKPQMERLQFMISQSDFNEKTIVMQVIILIVLQKIILKVPKKRRLHLCLRIVIN